MAYKAVLPTMLLIDWRLERYLEGLCKMCFNRALTKRHYEETTVVDR